MTLVRSSPSGQLLDVSSGGGGSPLPALRYVDPSTTVPLTQQNGSQAAPFATIAQAIDAVVTSPFETGTIMLCAGNYDGQGFTWDPAASSPVAQRILTIWGSPSVTNIGTVTVVGDPSFSAATVLALRGIGVGGTGYNTSDGPVIAEITASNFSALDIEDSWVDYVNGFSNVHALRAHFNVIEAFYLTGSDILIDDGVFLEEGCEITNTLIGGNSEIIGNLSMQSCVVNGFLNAQSAQIERLRDSVFNSGADISSSLGFASAALFNCEIYNFFTGHDVALINCLVDSFSVSANTLTLNDTVIQASSVEVFDFLTTDTKSWNILRRSSTIIAPFGMEVSDLPFMSGQQDWDASGVLNIELLPLEHAPGLYQISVELNVRTGAGPGSSLALAVMFSDINGDFRTLSIPIFDGAAYLDGTAIDATGTRPVATVTISSNAQFDPITLVATPSGVSDTPSISLMAVATPISAY